MWACNPDDPRVCASRAPRIEDDNEECVESVGSTTNINQSLFVLSRSITPSCTSVIGLGHQQRERELRTLWREAKRDELFMRSSTRVDAVL